MNIIICGTGRVGYTIAKLLSEQNHSITVIDQSSEDIQKINESLDVRAIVGKATYPSVLEKANAAEADMIIAVTKNDEINMLICQIAFSIFKVQKKIARIRSSDYLNPKFSKVYNKENLPIDVIISPEIEIAKSIQRKLEAPGALDNVNFAQNKIRLLEILVTELCPITNTPLNELTKKFPKLEANILGVIRKDIDDMRESPALKIIDILKFKGARISYHDPYIKNAKGIKYVEFNEKNLNEADAVLITTDHSNIDYKMVGEHANIVIDTRNVMANVKNPKAHILRA